MGGLLAQQWDLHRLERDRCEVVTKRKPTDEEWKALLFAWTVVKHVKSNAIVYANAQQTVGVGAGQMSRVDSARIAAQKAVLPLAGTRRRLRRLLPVPRRDRRDREDRRHRDHPARRLGARRGDDRRRRRARPRHGLHRRAALQALIRARSGQLSWTAMIGETVSRYRIDAELGSGGMGVVYRAHDLELDRDVALKFLPAALAADPAALARFEREARLASSLNHPHICIVHDIEQHDGHPFIVMELCTGETVKRLVQRGPIPLVQAVDLAIQTAGALDAAHRRGIVHRDVKPANLFVSPTGQLKVLDFGLAKLNEPQPALGRRRADSLPPPAPEAELTRPGMALGTVAYMSPEQALGQPVDARSDLFSLGAVLYEMVTGERAFAGALRGRRLRPHPEPRAPPRRPGQPAGAGGASGGARAAARQVAGEPLRERCPSCCRSSSGWRRCSRPRRPPPTSRPRRAGRAGARCGDSWPWVAAWLLGLLGLAGRRLLRR